MQKLKCCWFPAEPSACVVARARAAHPCPTAPPSPGQQLGGWRAGSWNGVGSARPGLQAVGSYTGGEFGCCWLMEIIPWYHPAYWPNSTPSGYAATLPSVKPPRVQRLPYALCLAPGEAGSGGGGGHAPQDVLLVVFRARSSAPAFCRHVRVLGGIQNPSESFGHKLSSLFR